LNTAQGALRLVQFNLNFRNPVVDRVADALTAMDADIITLQEVPPSHEATLRGMTAYPHQAHCFFREYIGGVSILSKHELSQIECANGEGLVLAKVDAPGGAVTVASIHTYWPWPYSQHAQIDRWVPRLARASGPMIVAGDFNAAPWSHAVAKVAEASRTRVVPGLRMTIEVMSVPIPIDHALLSEDFCGLYASVGPALGSDHFPVIFEIGRVDPSSSTGCSRH
jgi:endonuclease/exonuclease/phosphatase (EEP) superfamily protein YafD